jgi:hypothetical protein
MAKKRKVRIASRKSKFYCPESPYIAWHRGLIFAECPVSEGDRDMKECEKCPLLGEAKFKSKRSKKRYKKDIPKLERRGKEPIPSIGKTYTSEDKSNS